jgi:hypothetical protein
MAAAQPTVRTKKNAPRVWNVMIQEAENGLMVRVHDSRLDTSKQLVAENLSDAMRDITAAIVAFRLEK